MAGITDELKKLLWEDFEYSMSDIHVCMPGVVEKYDPKTRRADIQPSLKRKMPGGQFMDFSIVPDVPVYFPGTKKYTIHFPLEKGDEVALHVIERSTDVWRDNGGKGIEDADPRRFDLCDCYAVPGLQPVEFIPVEEDGLHIVHKTAFDGDFISSVTMDDDKVEVKYKEKASIFMEDDHINASTEKCSFDMTAQTVIMDNGRNNLTLDGDIALISKGSELLKIGNAIDSLGKMVSTLFQTIISMKTVGAPAQHVVSPDDIVKFTQQKAIWDQVFN